MKERAETIGENGDVRARFVAPEALKEASRKVADAYERTSEVAGRWGKEAVQRGKENPLTTTALVFGAGIGVGYLLSMDRSSRYSKRNVPAFVTAVAEAVRAAFDGRRA